MKKKERKNKIEKDVQICKQLLGNFEKHVMNEKKKLLLKKIH